MYDTDLDITWLADANFAKTSGFDTDGRMTWQNANDWAASLTVGGFNDWRLPTTTVPGPVCVSGFGLGCTGSEMGHLFYDELGGTAGSSILSSADPDLALFSHIQTLGYWSGTEFAPVPAFAWGFLFLNGDQFAVTKVSSPFAWAVRSGDVAAVPEPSMLLLLGSGLVGLIGFGWKNGRLRR